MKRLLAVIGALVTGGIGVVIAGTAQSASAALTTN